MAGLAVYLLGAISDVLVDLRNEWAVQILVLFSFALQVFLLMFAWIRRRQDVTTLLRFLLWLAYQLADSTALFTLGHMAIRARSPAEQQLMAFWAPFLLVHLGGQDTITAYSFEDNRLWLRHLQTLVVQFLGAGYVLYKYIPGSQRLIRMASVLMFVVGGLKYGERIWALRSASVDSIWSSLDVDKTGSSARMSESDRILDEVVEKSWYHPLDEEDILMASHGLLDVCKGIFIGSLRGRRGGPGCLERLMDRFRRENLLDMLMEMELSLMYDILYTKAAVIHTWCGFCIRVATPVATAAAFLLFHISSKGGHKKNDVIITYILLSGALLLETASLVKAALSTWTAAFLHATWPDKLYAFQLQDLRASLRAATYRRWSGSVGQYDLLQSWSHDMADRTRRSKLAELVGLERWWYQVCHSRSTHVSGPTKDLLLSEILQMDHDRRNVSAQPGLLALRKYKLDGPFRWSVEDTDLEGSIIAWHVATELYCNAQAADNDDQGEQGLLHASQELSRYMMFLFAVRPYMLPGPVRRSRYSEACDNLNTAMDEAFAHAQDEASKEERPPDGKIIKKHRLDWLMRTVRKLAKGRPLSRQQIDFLNFSWGEKAYAKYGPATGGFAIFQGLLRHGNNRQQLEVVFNVWVEMICFVANHCSRESHAGQLSSGGELITIAWLMANHANLLSPPASTATDGSKGSVQTPLETKKGPKYMPR